MIDSNIIFTQSKEIRSKFTQTGDQLVNITVEELDKITNFDLVISVGTIQYLSSEQFAQILNSISKKTSKIFISRTPFSIRKTRNLKQLVFLPKADNTQKKRFEVEIKLYGFPEVINILASNGFKVRRLLRFRPYILKTTTNNAKTFYVDVLFAPLKQ